MTPPQDAASGGPLAPASGGPLATFRARLAAGELATDPSQALVAERLQALWTRLRGYEAEAPAAPGFFGRMFRRRDDMPEDFYSIDLMSAYASLGRIIGEEVGDDLVNEIFSKFCMGK